MATGYQPKIVTEDIKLHLDFASPKCLNNGLTSVKDLVTGDSYAITNTGTDISLSTTTGGLNALEWAGSNNAYIDNLDTGSMALFTLEAWVYNVSGGDGRHSIFRNFWEIVGTTLAFWSYSFDNDYWRQTASGKVPYDEWSHIVTTWDGERIRHYINGVLEYTQPDASGGTSESMYTIAGYSGRKYKGKLGGLSVYTKTLSQTEILQNYLAKKSRFEI